MSQGTTYDAIVVGSGITGGWAAKELTERGLNTLVLEAGRDINPNTDYVEHMQPWELRFRGRGDRKALENRARDMVCVTGYPSGPLDDNVRIELTVNRLGASRQGVVVLGFGRDPDVAGQYSFSVTADRRVELCRSDGGTCQRLVYKAGVTAVHIGAADENRLAVEIRGRRITLFVNGETIDAYTANRRVMGALSLGVGPRTDVDVTHVVVRRLGVAPTGR